MMFSVNEMTENIFLHTLCNFFSVELVCFFGCGCLFHYNGSKVLTGNRIIRCNYERHTLLNLHKLLKIITF